MNMAARRPAIRSASRRPAHRPAIRSASRRPAHRLAIRSAGSRPTRRLAALIALLAVLPCAAPARAAFTGATLVSGNPALALQADYAYDPAISANGAYVAFTASIASTPGVYRKDLLTGALDVVALGDHSGAPSISADGRYVSFTTDEEPSSGQPLGVGACSSVYVRDMTQASSSPGAYTLASAASGSSQSLTYAPLAGQPCGAAAASRVALSADGRSVAFTTLSPSDLSAPCSGTPTSCPTPPDQVAVRNLDSQTTTLASVTLQSLGSTPQAVPGGAALAGPPTIVYVPPGGAPVDLAVSASSAALSADGSTVAWMGANVPLQSPIAQPLSKLAALTPDAYAEPLWRRIADGPASPSRRILAGDDASASACPPACPGGLDPLWDEEDLSGFTGAGPAYGSFLAPAGFGPNGFQGSLQAVTPQLSANGLKVALLSTQPDYGHLPEFGPLNQTIPPTANAFVVDMTPGLSREQAIDRVTNWASLDFHNPALDAALENISFSPDGTRVAFATRRIAFPLAPPALVTPPLSQVAASELYEANLKAGTLELISQGYDGQPANENVSEASFSGSGETLAFAASATNLAYGVVNEGSDVFLTSEINSPEVLAQQSIGTPPPDPDPSPLWRLSATATRGPNGTLLIEALVPGAGSLSASASASVSIAAQAARSAKDRTSRRTGKSRSHSNVGPASGASVATRRVASARMRTGAPGLVQLRLTPLARYRSLAYGRYGLYATLTLSFTAPGHPGLTQTLQANFQAKSAGTAAHAKAKRARSRTRRALKNRGRR